MKAVDDENKKKKLRSINGAVLDIKHAADYLGITDRGLRARVARRQVPFHRWDGRITFRRDELDRFLEALEGCSLQEALENVSGGE